ncbi:hypothetical protein [Streptomyces alboniger]|uniref:Uncharacterized protein n=1 Tax=Streptomyces alboniger TaxID=132473 RepID=A0A5J6H820_STRAD|nr:hypothetical protein [Streptomyces alboniger]QEV16149.1 hypothetical protein CP975_00150 [Streptomyces alboniger]
MDIAFDHGETTSVEVSLHDQEVENVGVETELIPTHLTTYMVEWVDSVSWDVAAKQAQFLTLHGTFRSGISFRCLVHSGVPCHEQSRHQVCAGRRIDVPPLTRVVISVVGTHSVERVTVSGAAVGSVVSSRITDLRFKLTMLTPGGDHIRTQYAEAKISRVFG